VIIFVVVIIIHDYRSFNDNRLFYHHRSCVINRCRRVNNRWRIITAAPVPAIITIAIDAVTTPAIKADADGKIRITAAMMTVMAVMTTISAMAAIAVSAVTMATDCESLKTCNKHKKNCQNNCLHIYPLYYASLPL